MNNHHSASGIEETRPAGQGKWSQWGNFGKDLLKIIPLGFLLFMGISLISARVRVENISMMPTVQPGEFVLVDKLAYKLGGVHHGDIIIFHHVRNQSEGQVVGWFMRTIGITIDDDYIKRIIGLPGDEIQVQGGKVYVNGIPMDEDYISAPPTYTGHWTVPKDSLFVLGDNRNVSYDSHNWGFVPLSEVVGRAVVIYWPLQAAQVLNEPHLVKAATGVK